MFETLSIRPLQPFQLMKRPPAISLSPSAASRWLTCTASPRFIMENHDNIGSTDTVWNIEGDMAHAVANAVLLNRQIPSSSRGKPIPKDKLPEMIKHAKGFKAFVDEPGAVSLESERKISLWYMTTRSGYIDVATIGSSRGVAVRITDLKYGQGVAVNAEDNEQMAIYARSWVEETYPHDPLSDDTVFELCIYQPRIRDGDKESIWRLTWAELKAYTDKIGEVAKRIQAGRDEVFRPSTDACRFCPMKKPAKGPPCAAYIEWTGADRAIVFSDVDPNLVMTDLRSFTLEKLLLIAANRNKIKNFVDDVYKQFYGEAVSGNMPKGFKLVRGKGSRSWSEEQEAEDFLEVMFGDGAFAERKLISPNQAETEFKKLGMKPGGLMPFIRKFEGKVVLAPIGDPRPSIQISANDVFENLDLESLPESDELGELF